MQKNVVIRLRLETATGRNILAGILKGIRDRDNCSINIASDDDGFMRLAETASAVIADSSASVDTIRRAIADGKPVVLLNDWRLGEHPSNLGHIRTDDGEIGFKAADYFMSIGRFRSFGFVPAYAGKEWSIKRGRAFALRLKRKGHECLMFSHGDTAKDIGAWLKELPKPAAVFCAWDAVAAEVATAARAAKVKIPSQLVLLGVDNDEVYCTSSSPQMSSIEFDAENEGRVGMELLLKMMKPRGEGASRTICCGSAKRIVERDSTRPPAPAAHLIESARKFISENTTKGIGPKDVAAHLGVSRSLLDLRFREMGDATVGELILERRLAALSAMLRSKSKSPICRAIRDCGFGSVNHAKAVFKKRFDVTMREWRSTSPMFLPLPCIPGKVQQMRPCGRNMD